jgi:diguanylate cyclase (GGDEF)-like protein
VRPIASFVKPWQRIAAGRPQAGAGSDAGGGPDDDTRSGFDDLRRSLAGELEREADSPLLARASLEALLDAFVVRAQQRRNALGLIAFELEDWKGLRERAGATGFASVISTLGRELRRRLRSSDEIGRMGEGQIAAVLPGCEPQALGGVSERLRAVLEALELVCDDQTLRPSISVATFSAAPRPGSAPVRLLEALADALDRARG